MRNTFRTITMISLLAAPLALAAQGTQRSPDRPGGPMTPQRAQEGPGVTQILNARRVLDLSARQVAQLDSIERTLFTARKAVETRMRAVSDSMRTAARANAERNEGRMSEAQRDSVRRRMETMRPQMEEFRTRDSTARAAALRLLTDAQRQQLREIQAEERGRQRGMMESRRRGNARSEGRERVNRERELRERVERRRPEGDATP